MYDIMHVEASNYLAGLERDYLFKENQWHCMKRPSPRWPTEYCAPSWSWASTRNADCISSLNFLDTKAGYHPQFVSKVFCEILDSKTVPISDPYEQVSGGYLRLRGLLCQIILRERNDAVDASNDEGGLRVDSIVVNGVAHSWKTGASYSVSWDGDTRETLLRHNGPPFYFIRTDWQYDEGRTDFERGLLLKQTRNRRGEYQLVGFVTFYEKLLKDVRDGYKATTLQEDAYQEFDGVDRYTIEVV
jgi:hypothetical protein